MAEAESVQFAVHGGLARITLNRPTSLNALTLGMVSAIGSRLADWARDDDVRAVLIDAAGRAFCAGGDVRALAEATPDGRLRADFYRQEYALNHLIFTYPKPYISFLDGVVMGGGAGISVHGTHRVATEATVFAMPETAIGFFPDVGGSFFLPRLPGRIGLYLGLTGARLGPADVLSCGLATHYVPSAAFCQVAQSLFRARSPDDVESILDEAAIDPGPATLPSNRAAIERCFAAESVAGIGEALRSEAGNWARDTRAGIAAAAPFSLCVTHRLFASRIDLGETREAAFGEAMRREYRLSQRLVARPDFREGVRAMLVDKDRAAKWSPARVEDVNHAEVAACFTSLGEDDLYLGS